MEIREDVLLAPRTTLKVGGRARYFAEPQSLDDLKRALAVAQEQNLPVVLVGEGSNVLVRDEDVHAVVVRPLFKGVRFETQEHDVAVYAAAGEHWDDVVQETVARGVWGIENLSGIPGSVGAAPIQNIGAYGVELRDVIQSVHVFDRDSGVEHELIPEECVFGYRDSVFKHEGGANYIVLGIRLRLSPKHNPKIHYKDVALYFENKHDTAPTLGAIRSAILSIRSKKFPDLREVGTAGSFFKNPIIDNDHYQKLVEAYPNMPHYPVDTQRVKVPLAWILEHICGVKGYTVGHVGLWKEQPLVLVNFGEATAQEINRFADDISERVKKETGIVIEREVRSV